MLMQNNANGSAGARWLPKPSDSGMNQPTKYHLKYMSKDRARWRKPLHHFTRLSALTIALAVFVTSAAAQFRPDERVAAVSRDTDTLDVFAVDYNAVMYHARWDPSGGWQGWSNISQGESKAAYSASNLGPVTAVSTFTGEVDVFTTTFAPNQVVTARSMEPNCCYAGWTQIGNLVVDVGNDVSAVSRGPYKFDIFTQTNGQIWTAAYDLSNGLRGWWLIPGPKPPTVQVSFGCCARVAAASPVTDELYIFAIDVNGNLQASSWAPYLGGWTTWRPISGVQLDSWATVTAISRAYGQLELFVTDVNGNIQTTTVLPSFSGWRPIGKAARGAIVTGVSRHLGWLDIFVVANDQVLTQGSPSPSSFNSNSWRPISGLLTDGFNGAAVAAVSRSQDHLDVFVIGFDGALWTGAWEPDFVQPGVSDWHVFQVPLTAPTQ